ncbi:MAG: ABC transporter ATP-binding protein [Candidatus Bathyarchaeia archaeon]
MQTILKGESITKNFGGLVVLKDVNFEVHKGEILGLIGPNGAGKTTLFNLISGAFPPTNGKIFFEEKDITRLKAHQVCRLGIARTFQLVRPFNNMSVIENVTSGAIFGREGTVNLEKAREKASFIIDFIGLRKKDALAKDLTLHEKKMLELARALASNPKVLLIDEVMAGLNAAEVQETMKLISRIRDELNVTVFWIEHVMKAVMGLAERIIVLGYGKVIAEGKPAEIANLPAVIDIYLGGKSVE